MASKKLYSEELPCGGTLKVEPNHWEIEYYFPGPDLRYNGTFFRVSHMKIDDYISAFKQNWLEYERLRMVVPSDGEFSKQGILKMQIRINSYFEGVCIEHHYMPIDSKSALDRVIDSYEYAKQRAPKIQELLGEA